MTDFVNAFLQHYDGRRYAFENYYSWINAPILIQQGTADEKEAVRRQISHMIAYQVSLSSSSSGGTSGGAKPMDWATFNCLQAMKQTTFNTYMWAHYSGWTPMGKSW